MDAGWQEDFEPEDSSGSGGGGEGGTVDSFSSASDDEGAVGIMAEEVKTEATSPMSSDIEDNAVHPAGERRSRAASKKSSRRSRMSKRATEEGEEEEEDEEGEQGEVEGEEDVVAPQPVARHDNIQR